MICLRDSAKCERHEVGGQGGRPQALRQRQAATMQRERGKGWKAVNRLVLISDAAAGSKSDEKCAMHYGGRRHKKKYIKSTVLI